MSNELSLTTDEIRDLAERLDGWDGLSAREREVLGGVFALAGAAIAAAQPEDEVSGFALTGDAGDLGGGALESFQAAMRKAGGDPKSVGKPFLTFTFKLVAVKTVSWAHD